MKRRLIVNADDCNLTPGVSEAILDCHDHGILSSTTFMMNLPIDEDLVRGILKRKLLGVGIHLNVTFGYPVSKPNQVKDLLKENGQFKKIKDWLRDSPLRGLSLGTKSQAQLETEYTNQILFFQKVFGRLPTHLDTHHQVHDYPLFYEVFARVASRFKLPVRRSKRMMNKNLRTTDYLFGNLTTEGYWRKSVLESILLHLPEGVSEIMCHPGKNDSDLKSVSSFTAGRAVEWSLFRLSAFRQLLSEKGVQLSHFGLCYTSA